jgi:hypothetical protein
MAGRRAGRRTNVALLVALALALVSGVWGFLAGTSSTAWVLSLHAGAAVAVLVLAPWKRVVVRRGLVHGNGHRTRAVLLLAAVVLALASGFLHSTGVWRTRGPWSPMGIHLVAAALVVPLLVAHVHVRPQRLRRVDLDRRTLLRATALGAVGFVGHHSLERVLDVAGLPGADRRFTGSHEVASFDPDRMPVVQWLDDDAPRVDVATWTLRVGDRDIGYEELTAHTDVVAATLDCTGGWYSEQRWTGVRLSRLLTGDTGGRSLVVRSATGYSRRFPAGDADRLLLAWAVGGQPLSRGHGFPARLVAPGRRGLWWVKWVSAVDASDRPWWWQLPVPLT